MAQKQNYQSLLDAQLENIKANQTKPTLLLHACCAPCSSYVLEYLNEFFDITIFFYNPNIFPIEEYEYRANELKRLLKEMNLEDSVKIVVPEYAPGEFFEISKGKEDEKERGSRCTDCYNLRLRKTFLYAKENRFDYYTTTLSISPHKDAERINNIGIALAKETNVKWLYSDFKKKNGYIRSIQLSQKYNLYRQNYCGCIYSKQQTKNT